MLNAFQSMEYENNKKYITNTANKRQKNEKKRTDTYSGP
jgi:hypothetical protein